MDVRKLEALVIAAETGSLSAAARRLGVDLATVSRRIGEIEDVVGVSLLIRSGRGVRLTPGGTRFVQHARRMLHELTVAIADAKQGAAQSPALLRVSVPGETALSLLPEVSAALLAAHPHISVDMIADARRVSLREEGFDAAIRVGTIEPAGLLARKLGAVCMVLCGRPGTVFTAPDAVAGRRAVSVHLAPSRWLGTWDDQGRVSLDLLPRARVATFSEAAALAAQTDLVAVLPSYTARRFLATGELAVLAPAFRIDGPSLSVLMEPSQRREAVLRDLAKLVSEALARANRAVGAASPPPTRRAGSRAR